jgi:cell division protein FtsI (penicillin-binding protein 3)
MRQVSQAALARLARKRIAALSCALLVVFGVLGVRLVQLQAFDGAHYEDLALSQRLNRLTLAAQRGSIFDRHGRDLALSVDAPTVWANPRVVRDPKYYAAQLAPVVGVDEATLRRRLGDRDRQFVYVARQVDDETARHVRALDLPGVAFINEPTRKYPAGNVAAPLVGKVGGEGTGLGGLEYEYEDTLKGRPGEIVAERDSRGREIPRTVRSDQPARRGTDITLTIDEALQFQTERSLVDQVASTGARGGMAIVMDLKSGDVLAMSTALGPENGQPARPAGAADRNRPLTDIFEPGSTNKVITIAASLEAKRIGPYTEIEVPDALAVGPATYHDDHTHPTQMMSTTDILRESSNVGTIKIAQDLGKDRLNAALHAFGLGEKTPIQFPGQEAGILLDPSEYYSTGIASVPIGYGVAVTAQQMLDVYATIANRGTTVPPRLVESTIDADGKREQNPLTPGRRVVSETTALTVNDMLTKVVSGGTGACAAIPGYTVAGKTGTSRKPLESGGYSSKHMASFIGYAPAEAPRVATIVVLDAPEGNQIYGGRAAAPVFAEVTGFALRMLRVPPPNGGSGQFLEATQTAQADQADCTVPHGEALAQRLAAKAQAAQQAAQAKEVQGAASPKNATDAGGAGAANQGGTGPAGTLPATPANQ